MAQNFGPGVSRALDAKDHQFSDVVWQKSKPPCDAELILMSQIQEEFRSRVLEAETPSGWIGDPLTLLKDYVTNQGWSNYFKFGYQRGAEKHGYPLAIVNGWVIPVMGTKVGDPPAHPNDADFSNKITLDPPPSGAGVVRTDFIFLEIWKAQLSPGSTTSKPTSTEVYKLGNAEFGGTNLPDDILDPELGFETTERVQIQYRIRVVNGISISTSNDGFDSSVVFAWGSSLVNTTFNFVNMRTELGDPGLWRAGDGVSTNSLDTVDGYSYAIPICAVTRRNNVVFNSETNPNGGVNQNNTAVTRQDVKDFITIPVLSGAITSTDTTINIASSVGINLPIGSVTTTVKIGDEILTYSNLSGTVMTVSGRGANGTTAQAHNAGDQVILLPLRPDGLFADQTCKDDIYDLRHMVSLNTMDYDSMLMHNLNQLLSGNLQTCWKRSGAGGVQGTKITYTDRISNTTATGSVVKIDIPDDHRVIFSDTAALQPNNMCISSPPAITGSYQDATTAGFDLEVTVDANVSIANQFNIADTLKIPISQFKTTFPTGQTDSVRFVLNSELANSFKIYVNGETVPRTNYTLAGSVNPTNLTSVDDLIITLTSGWTTVTSEKIFILFTLQYSPGRGLARTPTDIQEIKFANIPDETLIRPLNKLHIEPMSLWSKIHPLGYDTATQRVSESYVDLGSKTVVLQPYRNISIPQLMVKDGNSLNSSAGLMPPSSAPKDVNDPLTIFESYRESTAALKNLYVEFPKEWLCYPSNGEIYLPMLGGDGTTFHRGANFFLRHTEGAHGSLPASMTNYVTTATYLTDSQQFFTTYIYSPSPGIAAYNRKVSINSHDAAGMQKYNDVTTGRQGLQLPPFYGVARLWSVYLASDFNTNGSAFDSLTRAPTGLGATNLLRTDFDGPVFFVIEDSDGDSTFILNADAIDLNKSAFPPMSFMAGEYVIEASVFGFDRGFLTSNARVVLARSRTQAVDNLVRANNLIDVAAPEYVVPAPIAATTAIDVSYLRTPYQGDVLGTQESFFDVPYRAGSISSTDMLNIISNALVYNFLTLDNQKSFDVLSVIGFMTSIGSGSFSFPISFHGLNVPQIKVGAEDPSAFPPGSTLDPIPRVIANVLGSTNYKFGSSYFSNMIGNLPLGSLFRDKEFLGEFLDYRNHNTNYMIFKDPAIIHNFFVEIPYASSFLSESSNLLGKEYTPFTGVGSNVTLVDGITTDTTPLTKFRSTRGGSGYVSAAPIPGGPIESYLGSVLANDPTFNSSVVFGLALLVRSGVEVVNSNELLSGDELQMVIITNAYKPSQISYSDATDATILNSPTGSGEGYSAVDRYRIQGHPLKLNRNRYVPDTTSITLAKKV